MGIHGIVSRDCDADIFAATVDGQDGITVHPCDLHVSVSPDDPSFAGGNIKFSVIDIDGESLSQVAVVISRPCEGVAGIDGIRDLKRPGVIVAGDGVAAVLAQNINHPFGNILIADDSVPIGESTPAVGHRSNRAR